MALIVRVYINTTQVSVASAVNQSNLADVSDYACASFTDASKFTNNEEMIHEFTIDEHDRNQSVWALVAKMAERIAELENKDK